MTQVLSRALGALRLGGSLAILALSFAACDNGSSLASNEGNLPPVDSTPTDTTTPPPPDTTTPPPPDTTPPPPPPDTTLPPPPSAECSVTGGGDSATPVHVGLPYGPAHNPPEGFGPDYTGSLHSGSNPACLMAELAAARRTNTQLIVNLTGNESNLRDANGFSMTKWKQRVDRFRHLNLDSYIADGTLLAHFILDEPSDKSNWAGHQVSLAEIQEMARYSKEIWPKLPTMIRVFPEYLRGGDWKDLDAVRFHYLARFGSVDDFIARHFGEAEALGLRVIGGLNVINGGSGASKIPGRNGKWSMSPDEIRDWGSKFLARPGMCAFFLYEYDSAYFSRPEIKAAMEDLAVKAKSYSQRSCAKN